MDVTDSPDMNISSRFPKEMKNGPNSKEKILGLCSKSSPKW